jgi:hypothetical protein
MFNFGIIIKAQTMSEKISTKHILLLGILLLAAFSRLIPHPPNFTALGAMVLFGGAYFSNRILAILLPLGALWLSDIFLNNLVYSDFYSGFVLFSPNHVWIYISFIVIGILCKPLYKKVNAKSVGLSAIFASVIFFILSNFGVWIQGFMYPMSFSGLIACYVAAIPFFGWTIVGNVVYCSVLFGCFEFANKKLSILQAR